MTWLSVGVNLAMGAVKVWVGLIGHSRALVADGLHSITDLTSDTAVLLGLAVASRPPDENHPYGHYKAANLVTLFLSASLLFLCGLLLLNSVRGLRTADVQSPSGLALAVALGSIGVKEFLFWRTRNVGVRTGSRMLLANAWHHRSDSVSSAVAAVGIALAMVLGPEWAFLDTVVGITLAAWLGLEGVRQLLGAINDLMDAAPDRRLLDDLREHILPVEGAVAYHDFRARRIGDQIEIDFHLLVSPTMNVQEAHGVAQRVKREILDGHPEVVNVLVHVEPALPEHHRDRGVADGEVKAPSSSS